MLLLCFPPALVQLYNGNKLTYPFGGTLSVTAIVRPRSLLLRFRLAEVTHCQMLEGSANVGEGHLFGLAMAASAPTVGKRGLMPQTKQQQLKSFKQHPRQNKELQQWSSALPHASPRHVQRNQQHLWRYTHPTPKPHVQICIIC